MYLKKLHLHSFRNYGEQQVEFNDHKTILLGDNAQGKTNLLEAVELLSTLKSHRTTRERDLVMEGATVGQIAAICERRYAEQHLALTLRPHQRRSVMLNGETLRRHLDILGILNSVQFSSLDLELVRGSPENRRHWLDGLLVQLEPVYAYILQQYQQVLRQRNALLKKISQEETLVKSSMQQLKLWDEQLATTGARVTRRRARVIERLAPLALEWHASISGKTELLELKYTPNVAPLEDDPEKVREAFLEKIQQRRQAETNLGTTVVGPHRDEVEFMINHTPARSYGSQGQQRTLVLALKLAELKLIAAVVGEPPLLLLDDVLAELDPHRQNQLLLALGDRFQTLITTTHLNAFDPQWLKASQILVVEAGKIK
ncbi:MAG: DNA replication/repair protein RecF [Gomphosphaeria aponina SAG 52.96 = DSM 107014]|uniref:DNA replication and repair protein RecF n=1 Tax=Gomphosphaeria aponina SAG 52.96 = DSM 107014 TaxID=1521640 RepID=A0A941JV21_9CHRO|nr:DNA replication/repair protein RecF [Gomphosphaeria aponina SAG 52.96 = DSM 107014]